jgi:hypothetical protein
MVIPFKSWRNPVHRCAKIIALAQDLAPARQGLHFSRERDHRLGSFAATSMGRGNVRIRSIRLTGRQYDSAREPVLSSAPRPMTSSKISVHPS